MITKGTFKLNTNEDFYKNVTRIGNCWIWKGLKNESGYGMFSLNGRQSRAHRISYEIHIGAIPEGLFICHKCDNPACVNPDHLFSGTAKENSMDMMKKGRNMHVTKPETLARGERNGTHTKPETVRRGTKIEWSKLTDNSVMEIRSKYANGESAPSLAKKHNVFLSTIYKVVYRKTWKHIK